MKKPFIFFATVVLGTMTCAQAKQVEVLLYGELVSVNGHAAVLCYGSGTVCRIVVDIPDEPVPTRPDPNPIALMCNDIQDLDITVYNGSSQVTYGTEDKCTAAYDILFLYYWEETDVWQAYEIQNGF